MGIIEYSEETKEMEMNQSDSDVAWYMSMWFIMMMIVIVALVVIFLVLPNYRGQNQQAPVQSQNRSGSKPESACSAR